MAYFCVIKAFKLFELKGTMGRENLAVQYLLILLRASEFGIEWCHVGDVSTEVYFHISALLYSVSYLSKWFMLVELPRSLEIGLFQLLLLASCLNVDTFHTGIERRLFSTFCSGKYHTYESTRYLHLCSSRSGIEEQCILIRIATLETVPARSAVLETRAQS